jgi:cytochrome P450
MLELAPPERHRALRNAMQAAFQGHRRASPGASEAAREQPGEEPTQSTRRMVERFLAQLRENDVVEFVDAFARKAAAAMIASLLGASAAEAAQLAPALQALGGIDFASSARAVQQRERIELWLLRELTRVVHAHRRQARGGGLIERLFAAEIGGQALSDHEVTLNCLNVVLAGTGASQHTLAGAVAVWSRHPEALDDAAQEPALVPGLIEETLRWLTPVTHLTRMLTRPVEILGREIPQGACICLWNVSANRDEEVFEDAASFRPDRAPNRHLSFGVGPQYCLGARIARMQLRELLHGLLAHGVRFEPCGEPVWMRSNAIAGVESLPVRVRRLGAVQIPDRAGEGAHRDG